MTAPTAVEVGPARPEEYGDVGRVCVAAYTSLDFPLSDEYAADLRDVAGRAADAGVVVLVARLGGRVVGHATVVFGESAFVEYARPGEAWLRMVAVDPAVHGRGVGTSLVQHALQLARERGLGEMWLYTQPVMLAAQHLYERLGFHRVPERDTTVLRGTLRLLAYERLLSQDG